MSKSLWNDRLLAAFMAFVLFVIILFVWRNLGYRIGFVIVIVYGFLCILFLSYAFGGYSFIKWINRL